MTIEIPNQSQLKAAEQKRLKSLSARLDEPLTQLADQFPDDESWEAAPPWLIEYLDHWHETLSDLWYSKGRHLVGKKPRR